MLHILWRENVENITYLGVTITNDLRWNTHVSNVCIKANRTLGFLRRNLYRCPQEVKEAAYKGLVRPVLECSGSVWDPSGVGLQSELEKVQNRAARFVTGNYNFETGGMTGILEHLKWESLKKRRRDSRLILLYKGLKGKASIPTDDLIPLARRCRNDHSMAFEVPIANTNIYKCSSPPPPTRPLGIGMHFQTLLSPLLKVPRMVLLSSLLWWELGTNLPGHGLGEWLSFWRVTSTHFWFWFWLSGIRPGAQASARFYDLTHFSYLMSSTVIGLHCVYYIHFCSCYCTECFREKSKKDLFLCFSCGQQSARFLQQKVHSAVPIFLSILQSVISDHNGRHCRKQVALSTDLSFFARCIMGFSRFWLTMADKKSQVHRQVIRMVFPMIQRAENDRSVRRKRKRKR